MTQIVTQTHFANKDQALKGLNDSLWVYFSLFIKDFIYLFLETGEGREKERERNIDRLPLICTLA